MTASATWTIARVKSAVLGSLVTTPILAHSFFSSTDEGYRRAVEFWSFALPAYVHYEFTDVLYRGRCETERAEAFRRLHEKYAPATERLTLRLGGYYVKAAQLMSTQTGFTPVQYLQWCERIQDQAPPTLDFPQVRAKLAEAGISVSALQEQPVGAASIGAVYRGEIQSPASTAAVAVAVKVKTARTERLFRQDMQILRKFCALALPQLVVPLAEIERQFLTEFDYRVEAANLNLFRKNLLPHFGDKIEIPRAYENLCTRDILVMDFLDGRKIADVVQARLAEEAARRGVSESQLRQEFQERLRLQPAFSVDTYVARLRRYVTATLLGGGDSEVFARAFSVVETVLRVHGHQVLVDGVFNGDPHPGNLLLLRNGKIGLIDFGQVKTFSRDKDTRLEIAKLVVAVHRKDKEHCAQLVRQLGVVSKFNDVDTQYKMISFWLDRDTDDVTEGLNPHKFLETMEKRDPCLQLNPDLVMVCRCALMVRALASILGLKVRTTDYWAPLAEKILLTG